MKTSKTGTKEWADKNINIVNGCSNDCLYCYAKAIAIRHKRKTADSWKEEQLKASTLEKNFRKTDKKIMFPSSHDISEQYLDETLIILEKLLSVGNEVLIVTKPRSVVIKRLCADLDKYRNQIEFRFTIGSADNKVLQLWEPGAPLFEERLEALKYAYNKGFSTSVSCEPMLDRNIINVVNAVEAFVTNTIWIGKMNRLNQNISHSKISDETIHEAAGELLSWQNDDKNMLALIQTLDSDPKIRWKDSMHKYLH